MPRFVIRTDRPEARALADALTYATSLSGRDELDLNELGKALHSIAVASRAAFVTAGLASMRMDATVKALDLRTKKSDLAAFLAGDRQED